MEMGGLVLDVFDDFNGATLREIWPTIEDVPMQVKQAHALSSNERASLPDDVFALVMVDGNEKQRKYACIDRGNTELSLQYFLKNASKLPAEAQKTAAENLKIACSWYKIDAPPELEKIAGVLGSVAGFVGNRIVKDPVGTAMHAVTIPSTIKGTHQAIKENLGATQALASQGAGVVSPMMRDMALGRKVAEVSGTSLMPSQPPADKKVRTTLAVVDKTATVGHLVAHSGKDVPPQDNIAVDKKEQPTDHPQAGHLHPTVDVSNKEPPHRLVEKKASRFALPSAGKYPIDSYKHIKLASAYFEEHLRAMPPSMRHEFATNLIKRAAEVDVKVSDLALKYGSETFAPDYEIKAAFDARRLELEGREEALDLLAGVERVTREKLWKEAGAPVPLTPEAAVSILEEFDKVAGLNHYYDRGIPDPYYSVLGFEKRADADWSEIIGNQMVTSEDLNRLAKVNAYSLKSTFGHDFQEEFLKDPVGIFQSLPLDQKKMLMNMAQSTQPGEVRTQT